jgi:Golgi nucleoside diphosphatase
LGYGANEARRRYYEHLSGKQKNSAVIADPCSHKDLKFEEELGDKKASFVGTGDLEQCKKSLLPILNETAPCDDYPCFFDGVHAPEKDLSMERWIAVSEYWYTTNTFDLGGPYQYDKILKATKDFCESPWDAAKKLLEEDDEYRLRTQCFKMAWVMTMLHEGFDLPLHPDPSTGKHPVDSKDDISKVSISWTLGAVLLQLTQEQAFVKDSKASYVKQLVHTWNNPIIPFESDADNSQPPYIDDDSSDISSILFFLFVVVALTSILLAYYLYKQDGFNSLRVMCCGRTNGVQAWLSHRNRFMPVTVTERDIEMGGNFRVSSMSNASSSPMASASSILPSIAAAANVTQTRFPVRPQSTVPHTAASSTALLGTMK